MAQYIKARGIRKQNFILRNIVDKYERLNTTFVQNYHLREQTGTHFSFINPLGRRTKEVKFRFSKTTPISASSATRSRRDIEHSLKTCSTSWIFMASQAEYCESFNLNLCSYCVNPPCLRIALAKADVESLNTLTSPSLPFFTLHIAFCNAIISAWNTVQKRSSRNVKYQISSPSCHSVRASVSVDVQSDYCETVQGLKFRSSTLSYPISSTCAEWGKSPKYAVFSSSQSKKVSPKSLPRFISYNQVTSLASMSRGSSLKMISAEWRETVRCARNTLMATLH
ncbi:hypothetical protein EVAR_28255_1 [Eumeta japonica]|uniref:Uncharacterized protein n=1 Tax=Eumeta variegata TaxID=151549 RepID=A0A4C1V5Q1_EUMVA|nr:hypothetical protein EVAR_28255_1 [Eumeta japonica]